MTYYKEIKFKEMRKWRLYVFTPQYSDAEERGMTENNTEKIKLILSKVSKI